MQGKRISLFLKLKKSIKRQADAAINPAVAMVAKTLERVHTYIYIYFLSNKQYKYSQWCMHLND